MRASALSLGRTPDMDVVVLLGAPGAGKGTQAPLLATRLGMPDRRHRRPVPGRRPRRHAAGHRGPALHGRRPARARRDHRPPAARPARPRRRGRRRDPRRLPADGAPGGGARRRARRPRRRGQGRGPRRRPRRGAHPPHVRALGLPRGRPPVPRAVQPAARRGHLRPRRLGALPALRRPPGDHPRADGPAAGRARRRPRPLPRRRASCARSTASRSIDEVADEVATAVAEAGVAPHSAGDAPEAG